MKIPTVSELEAALRARGWVSHREIGRLNIIILRKTPGKLDAFDDMLCVLYTAQDGERTLWACRCTADPGKPSRENPKRRDGTAVWAESQLVNGFGFGLHHGEYTCYVPLVPVPVLRYTSVDDPTGTPSTSNATQIHRASSVRESTVVGPWSEGCTVVASPTDYDRFIELGRAQVATGRKLFTVAMLPWKA